MSWVGGSGRDRHVTDIQIALDVPTRYRVLGELR